MEYSFDLINFNTCIELEDIKNDNIKNTTIQYDKTTSETYRIKRLYKIDPIYNSEIETKLIFEFKHKWNPYNGIREEIDIIGPLCFNAINLYDYYYINRFKGLWTPPQDGFQGIYGDIVGSGKCLTIKSRGSYPEKYLFRLPIIDCYLPLKNNLSIVTMGPELTENEISQIDDIIMKYHPKKNNPRFTSLTLLKYYYDRSLDILPDSNLDEIKELKQKYSNLTSEEINYKYNRYYVDKLVNLKY
jgi:hypothetical protein